MQGSNSVINKRVYRLVTKSNYEVTRYGVRYVKERRRQCFCGADGVTSGCDTWCGQPHMFIDEAFCDQSYEEIWAEWEACDGSFRKVIFFFNSPSPEYLI